VVLRTPSLDRQLPASWGPRFLPWLFSQSLWAAEAGSHGEALSAAGPKIGSLYASVRTRFCNRRREQRRQHATTPSRREQPGLAVPPRRARSRGLWHSLPEDEALVSALAGSEHGVSPRANADKEPVPHAGAFLALTEQFALPWLRSCSTPA